MMKHVERQVLCTLPVGSPRKLHSNTSKFGGGERNLERAKETETERVAPCPPLLANYSRARFRRRRRPGGRYKMGKMGKRPPS